MQLKCQPRDSGTSHRPQPSRSCRQPRARGCCRFLGLPCHAVGSPRRPPCTIPVSLSSPSCFAVVVGIVFYRCLSRRVLVVFVCFAVVARLAGSPCSPCLPCSLRSPLLALFAVLDHGYRSRRSRRRRGRRRRRLRRPRLASPSSSLSSSSQCSPRTLCSLCSLCSTRLPPMDSVLDPHVLVMLVMRVIPRRRLRPPCHPRRSSRPCRPRRRRRRRQRHLPPQSAARPPPRRRRGA